MTIDHLVDSRYRCSDGSPFPVTWDNPEQAELTWDVDLAHNPRPALPFEVGARRLGQAGFNRAFERESLQVPALWAGSVYQNWWAFPRTPDLPGYQTANGAAIRALLTAHGGAEALWSGFCLPRIHEAIGVAAAHTTSIAAAADAAMYARGLTQVAAVALMSWCSRLQLFLREEVPTDDAEMLFMELTAGYPNATVDTDEELWQLARLAAERPGLREVLVSGPLPSPAAIAQSDQSGDFARRFDAFIDEQGRRAQGWQLIWETWQERPDIPLALVRRFLETNAASPRATMETVAARRETQVRELCDRLGPERASRLRTLVQECACYVPIREERAKWQLISFGTLRLAALRLGQSLVDAGRLANAADVLFLYPQEADAPAAGSDLQARVEERRADHAYWETKVPPARIGGTGFVPSRPSEGVGNLLKGVAASRGVATGRARLLDDPSQADRLQPGDVLVCRMTAPPWTPLFAIAAAVVTESGSILSHPSIAAREYGIPCVVNVPGAMSRIRDGQVVTVNGTAGNVTLL